MTHVSRMFQCQNFTMLRHKGLNHHRFQGNTVVMFTDNEQYWHFGRLQHVKIIRSQQHTLLSRCHAFRFGAQGIFLQLLDIRRQSRTILNRKQIRYELHYESRTVLSYYITCSPASFLCFFPVIQSMRIQKTKTFQTLRIQLRKGKSDISAHGNAYRNRHTEPTHANLQENRAKTQSRHRRCPRPDS